MYNTYDINKKSKYNPLTQNVLYTYVYCINAIITWKIIFFVYKEIVLFHKKKLFLHIQNRLL